MLRSGPLVASTLLQGLVLLTLSASLDRHFFRQGYGAGVTPYTMLSLSLSHSLTLTLAV